MSDTRVDLSTKFDPNAPATEDAPAITESISRIRFIQATVKQLEDERKEIQSRIIPLLRHPVAMLDPITGEPIIATAIQSESVVIDPGELFGALVAHFDDEDQADLVWSQVLKPREVDTKDGGLFQQAVERGDIPMEVVALVAKTKKSSAYIGFPKPRK